MNGRTVTSLIQEVTSSTGVDNDTATLIAKDFLALDVPKHEESGRDIEATFVACHKPGFDAYSFKLFLKDRYSLTDKQSSLVLKGFRCKCETQRSISRAISTGITDATWNFGSSCAWKDSHQPLNGEKFTLAKGIAVGEGSPIRPGEQWLCACDLRVEIPVRKEPKTSTLNKLWIFIKGIFNK